jgi:hypothetical protein
MEGLTQLQQNRRIIQDFSVTTLAAIPSQFGRLIYISSLRDLSSGRYEHAGLWALYREEAVQQALAKCHEEVFEGILETPLDIQERDLRACFENMPDGLNAAVEHWSGMQAYRVLLPDQSPDYLKELFCSNLGALLEILRAEFSTAHSGD